MTNEVDPNLADDLEEIVLAAVEAGAEGIWLIRGAQAAALALSLTPADETQFNLVLEPPHGVIVLMRFPAGDGKEAGIEAR